jgi:hypothetical protein
MCQCYLFNSKKQVIQLTVVQGKYYGLT